MALVPVVALFCALSLARRRSEVIGKHINEKCIFHVIKHKSYGRNSLNDEAKKNAHEENVEENKKC